MVVATSSGWPTSTRVDRTPSTPPRSPPPPNRPSSMVPTGRTSPASSPSSPGSAGLLPLPVPARRGDTAGPLPRAGHRAPHSV